MAVNDDFQSAVELINNSSNILITTHIRPDGDACGCMVAIGKAVKAQGKNVKYLLLSDLPEWYEFLFEEKPLIYNKDIKAGDLTGIDLIVLVDVNSDNQLPEFCDYLKTGRDGAKVLVFDHHITNDGLGDVQIIDSTASSTGLIVYDFLEYAGWQITDKIAEALFVAISTDTGWFEFSNTDSRTFAKAAELIEYGLVPSDLYRRLYQNFTPQRFRLMTRMFDSLELHFDDRYAVQCLTINAFEQTGASYKDTENLIDLCRRIKTVEVAALFVEQKDGKIRCSLRGSGNVNVRLIAQNFDGGGHAMAAGVLLSGTLEGAMQKIYNVVKQQIV
ncbi:MAG: bifunctional oligoribonuclease/PAP phosphatase NrnA [Sedimentisphaerales bacterium]|nr:bifunctional oligoribonuclease/PAP phosphatase NrnA [Sedimentisphaerales bacterium]